MDYVGMIGNAVGGIVNGIAQDRVNKTSIKEAEKNRRFNAEQAQIQRDATSPMRQMQQMRMGGFNPASLGSQVISQGGNSASSGELPSIHASTGFGDAANSALVGAQIENIKADTNKKKEEANNIHTETDWLGKVNQSKIDLNNSAIHLNEEEANRIATLTPAEKDEINVRISNLNKDTDRLVEVIENLKVERRLTEEEIKEVVSQTLKNRADARLSSAYANQLEQCLKYYVSSAKSEAKLGLQKVKLGKMELQIYPQFKKIEYNMLSAEAREAKERASQEEYNTITQPMDKALGYASDFVGILADAFGIFTNIVGVRNGSRMAGAMEKSADSRVQNANTKAYDSSVNAIEKESRATLNRSRSLNEQNKWYDHNGVPDAIRTYPKVGLPKRHKKK